MRTTILATGLLLIACSATAEIPPGMAGATFAVHCYDVGANALDGKPGVVSVQRGWSGAREVDQVVYDPQVVSIKQLENWLKKANTYIGTLEHKMATDPKKEITQ